MYKQAHKLKENIGKPDPKVFVVLDELNKYAPKDVWSPIKDVVLDIAEREKGGITQHIGASVVEMPDGRKITFLEPF